MTNVVATRFAEAEPPEDGAAPDEGFACPPPRHMGPFEFEAFVDEVAVHVSVALAYAGLDGQFDVCSDGLAPDALSGDLLSPGSDAVERAISFRNAAGEDLPVYVSCGRDGVVLVAVGREDDGEECVRFVSPPRTLREVDALLEDVVRAIEAEVPRPTFH